MELGLGLEKINCIPWAISSGEIAYAVFTAGWSRGPV